MCQSKSDGGIRCESHVKKALAEHQISYYSMVQQECADKGISIAPASLELTPDETSVIKTQVNTDPSVQKARDEAQRASQQLNKMQHMLTDALASGDMNRFATVIRQNNPEFKAINDDNETRRLKFIEDTAKARNENEREEAETSNKITSAELNARKVKLNGISKQQAIDAFKIYRSTGNSARALSSLKCLQDANKNAIATKDASLSKVMRVRTQMEKLAIAKKLINDPGYQEAESSPAFRNSPDFHKWDAKEKELHESYRMTSAYQNQVAAKISSYKTAGMNTTEMETAYKAQTVRKAKFIYQNIAEAHGASSPEARAAWEAYGAAKQKEHVF
jgi:hypothetical protein